MFVVVLGVLFYCQECCISSGIVSGVCFQCRAVCVAIGYSIGWLDSSVSGKLLNLVSVSCNIEI